MATRPLAPHISLVLSVAFSPDGQLLASGGADETIIMWDMGRWDEAASQPLGHALTGHQGQVASLAFSPDGQILAAGAGR